MHLAFLMAWVLEVGEFVAPVEVPGWVGAGAWGRGWGGATVDGTFRGCRSLFPLPLEVRPCFLARKPGRL